MSGLCKGCRHYEPFSVFWDIERWSWVDDDTPEGEAKGLAEFDESARYHVEEHWRLRRWGRCLLGETSGGGLKRPESKFGAIDFERYNADVRCAPDFGCNQFEAKP